MTANPPTDAEFANRAELEALNARLPDHLKGLGRGEFDAAVVSLAQWHRQFHDWADSTEYEIRAVTEGEAVDSLNWVESTLREDSPAGDALRERLGLRWHHPADDDGRWLEGDWEDQP